MPELNSHYEIRIGIMEYLSKPANLLKLGLALQKIAGPWEKFLLDDERGVWGWCRKNGLGQMITSCLRQEEQAEKDKSLKNAGYELVNKLK